MIIDKKRVFLYGSILLLILVGVYFATFVDSIGIANRNPLSTYANTSGETAQNISIFTNGIYNYSYNEFINWTYGGATETYVFKINISGMSSGHGISATSNNNITKINITIPSSGIAIVSLSGWGNATFTTGVGTANNWSINITGLYVSAFNESNGSTPTSSAIMGVNNSYETIYIPFNVTVANGTEAVLNWTISIYNSTGGNGAYSIDSGLGLLTGVDGLPPRGNTTNVTDSTNTRTSFSGTQYLKYDTTSAQNGVNITLTVNDYNADRVLLVYNSTGGSLNLAALRNVLYNSSFLNGNHAGGTTNWTVLVNNGSNLAGTAGDVGFVTALGSRSDVRLTTAPGYVFSFNISNNTWGRGASDGTTFKYVFVVYDLYNHSEIINNSNAEYVIARDTNVPSVTLTAPSDTTIDVSYPIKYTCSGSDTSSIASCSMLLTKPTGDTVTKTGCSEQTFTLTDTNQAGTNTIQCTVIDNVGRTSSTSKTFSVSSATTGGAGAGGGGGGGAGTTPENPVTVQQGERVDAGTLSATETFTSVAKEGTVTFTVAGGSHSAKVLDVTTDSITIEVSSTPQQLTLTTGETKEVDLTDDGKNDLSVTLKSITNGKADLVFKSLEVIAPPAGGEKPGVVTGEAAKPSYTWLWVVLIVIVIVLVIWYLGRKKQ